VATDRQVIKPGENWLARKIRSDSPGRPAHRPGCPRRDDLKGHNATNYPLVTVRIQNHRTFFRCRHRIMQMQARDSRAGRSRGILQNKDMDKPAWSSCSTHRPGSRGVTGADCNLLAGDLIAKSDNSTCRSMALKLKRRRVGPIKMKI